MKAAEIALVALAFLAIFLPAALPWKRGTFLFLGALLVLSALSFAYLRFEESKQTLRSLIPDSTVLLVLVGLLLTSLCLRVALDAVFRFAGRKS